MKRRPVWRLWPLAVATVLSCVLCGSAGLRIRRYLAFRPLQEVQNQCLSYARPATHIVYETDPAAARALVASRPEDYVLYSAPGKDYALGSPICLRKFAASAEEIKYADEATIFLHERVGRGSGGKTMLVRVALNANTSWARASSPMLCFDEAGEAWKLATMNSAPIRQVNVWMSPNDMSVWTRRNWTLPTRIYAGQPDPSDASHFTFDYEAYGVRDTVDGWLEVSGYLTLRPRHPPSPPATAPSSGSLSPK